MSVLDLLEWEDGVDDWLHSSLGQQRHNFSCEVGGDGDLLLERSCAQHSTDNVKTFAQDLVEIDLRLTTCHSTDEYDPGPQRCGFEAGREIRTAIQIEHDIKSAAASHAFRKSRKLL